MDRDYLQEALAHFNKDKVQWYGWRKTDDSDSIIPNDQRMKYEHIILNDDTAILPSKAEVDAKIQEIKDDEETTINKRESGKEKLKDLGLDDDEIQALMKA